MMPDDLACLDVEGDIREHHLLAYFLFIENHRSRV